MRAVRRKFLADGAAVDSQKRFVEKKSMEALRNDHPSPRKF